MYGTQDMARYRQAQLMREAEAFRRTKDTRAAHSAERRATVRKMLATAVGLVLWPIKH
jgi:hypothetical protein